MMEDNLILTEIQLTCSKCSQAHTVILRGNDDYGKKTCCGDSYEVHPTLGEPYEVMKVN